jgi:uncharacterized protein (DUF1778 family)
MCDIMSWTEKEIAMPALKTRSEKLDLRLTPDAKQMLQTAAATLQRSMSDFVLESALARAEETLSDRRHFGLSAENWDAFMSALDAPPPQRRHARLERLLAEPSVFENSKPANEPA